jgi:hypothetical protein
MPRARSALLRPRCSADTRLCARRAALPRPSCGDRRRCLLRNTCRFHRPACPQHRNPRRPTSRGRNSGWSRARRVLRRLDQPARSPGLRHKPIDRHNCTQTTDQPPTKVVGNVGSAAESEPAGGRRCRPNRRVRYGGAGSRHAFDVWPPSNGPECSARWSHSAAENPHRVSCSAGCLDHRRVRKLSPKAHR